MRMGTVVTLELFTKDLKLLDQQIDSSEIGMHREVTTLGIGNETQDVWIVPGNSGFRSFHGSSKKG